MKKMMITNINMIDEYNNSGYDSYDSYENCGNCSNYDNEPPRSSPFWPPILRNQHPLAPVTPCKPKNRTWVTNALVYNGKIKDLQRGRVLIVDDAVEKIVFEDACGVDGSDTLNSKFEKVLGGGEATEKISFTTTDRVKQVNLRDSKEEELKIDPLLDKIIDAKGAVLTPAFLIKQCDTNRQEGQSSEANKPSHAQNDAAEGSDFRVDNSERTGSSQSRSSFDEYLEAANLAKARSEEQIAAAAAARVANVSPQLMTNLSGNAARHVLFFEKPTRTPIDPIAAESLDNLFTFTILLILTYVFLFIVADAADIFCTTQILKSKLGELNHCLLKDCSVIAVMLVGITVGGMKMLHDRVSGFLLAR